MYTVKKRIKSKIKNFVYYTEQEAIDNGISYHRNPRLSFKQGELRKGDHILTMEGMVVPVISKNGASIEIPTNLIKSVVSNKISIKGSNGIFISIDKARNRDYDNLVKSVVDTFLNNGFDHVAAVNANLGSLRCKRNKNSEEKIRADKFFSRGEVREYLRMKALEYFRDAEISPADVLKKIFEGLDGAVIAGDFEAVKELGGMMLTASGEFDLNQQPITNNNLHIHSEPYELEGGTQSIGIIGDGRGSGDMPPGKLIEESNFLEEENSVEEDFEDVLEEENES
jgi:hypothetical protein